MEQSNRKEGSSSGESAENGREMVSDKKNEVNRKSGRTGLKIAAIIIVILVVVAAAGFATLTVIADLPPASGALYPYTITYDVLIPEGQTFSVGGTPLLILSTGDQLLMKVGDRTESFTIGQTKTITERTAKVTTLGIPITETNYMIDATYRGMVGERADFYLVVKTSRQIPSILIDRILPDGIMARPI
jgi:hypothetical protein